MCIKPHIYLILVMFILVGAMMYSAFNFQLSNKKKINPVACTMEAKLCPDGSAVGRSGPKCEFVECPSRVVQPIEENTAVLNQKILNEGIYITPLQVVSDSRCGAGMQCFWAGELIIKVRLEKETVMKEVDLKERGTVVFEGNNITFSCVVPEDKTNPITPFENYKFVFKVVPIGSKGVISGKVTLGPTCPVERIPPDPNCAPRGYATSISVIENFGTQIVKTIIQSDAGGAFSVTLSPGTYILQAHGGNVLPRCPDVSVEVKNGQTTTADISCDTGIR